MDSCFGFESDDRREYSRLVVAAAAEVLEEDVAEELFVITGLPFSLIAALLALDFVFDFD